jgi:predicted DNA-binding protein (MmcQ/YjbR family)
MVAEVTPDRQLGLRWPEVPDWTTSEPMAKDALHDRLLAITLRLPGAYEDRPWGSVHCKVDGKIFVGWGRLEDGTMSVGLRVDPAFQMMLVDSDPRFTVAKYVGKHGGVDMKLGPKPDWREVERFIVESYRLIAKKSRIKELDAPAPRSPRAKPRPASRQGSRASTGAPRRR